MIGPGVAEQTRISFSDFSQHQKINKSSNDLFMFIHHSVIFQAQNYNAQTMRQMILANGLPRFTK